MLRRHLLGHFDVIDLFVVIEVPAVLPAIFHDEFMGFPATTECSIGLYQRFEGVRPGNQLVVVTSDIARNGRIGQLGAGANYGLNKVIVAHLTLIAHRDLAHEGRAGLLFRKGAEITPNRFREHGQHITVKIHRGSPFQQRIVDLSGIANISSGISYRYVKRPTVISDFRVEGVVDVLGACRVNRHEGQMREISPVGLFNGVVPLGVLDEGVGLLLGPFPLDPCPCSAIAVLNAGGRAVSETCEHLGGGFAIFDRMAKYGALD